MRLREDQVVRYSRQILLPEIGGVGQKRLLASHVAVVAGGGTAARAAATYLAAAGVGRLSLCGRPSPGGLAWDADALRALNPDVEVEMLAGEPPPPDCDVAIDLRPPSSGETGVEHGPAALLRGGRAAMECLRTLLATRPPLLETES